MSAPRFLLLALLVTALPSQGAPVYRVQQPGPAMPLQFGYRDGAESIRITVDGDQVQATCNDQPLAKERLRRQGSRVLLYDPHLALTAQLDLWVGGGALRTFAEKRPMRVGLTLQVPSPEEVKSLGVDAMAVRKVTRVTPGLPAAKAGLVVGDVLVQLDGDPLVTESRLRSLLLAKKPGDKVRVVVLRGAAKVPCAITLEAASSTGAWVQDDGAAQNYVQGLRALGSGQQILEWTHDLGMPPSSAGPTPPSVHVQGQRMLVMSSGGAASSSSSAAAAGSDDPQQELHRLQQRLDQMERMLEKLIEMREKAAGKDDKSK